MHVLDVTTLITRPQLYATVLFWLLSELYETLPEVGDLDKPKLVLFFDEAHLLFNDMPELLFNKLLQVTRLIRSKGVGIYLCRKTRQIFPTLFWDNWATAFSMR